MYKKGHYHPTIITLNAHCVLFTNDNPFYRWAEVKAVPYTMWQEFIPESNSFLIGFISTLEREIVREKLPGTQQYNSQGFQPTTLEITSAPWPFNKCYQKKSNFSTLAFTSSLLPNLTLTRRIQARIAQLVAYRLSTGEMPGSNLSKGENFSMKISNWLNSNLNGTA